MDADETTPARPTMADVKSRNSVDHLFRSTQHAQLQFSLMAEAKANMMITVSSVVLTIAVTQFDNHLLRWPFVALTAFTLLALLFAVLAVLPTGWGRVTLVGQWPCRRQV